ncbi:MAG TPA: hypothetical protein VH415_02865 [Nitrososphaeraceae archaeon]
MSFMIPNVAFVFTTFSCLILLISFSTTFPFINYLIADVESISVASDETIDTVNLTGTFRSFQTSGVENSSGIKTDYKDLSNFGNWHLALEDGKLVSFDAILNNTEITPGWSYNIDSFKPSTEKYLQLSSRGTDIIRGIANISSGASVIEPNIGLAIMIIDLNKTNLIFENDKLEVKSPIVGSIDSIVNSRGEVIGIDSSNVTRKVVTDGDDEIMLSNPQFAGDDGSGSVGDDGSDPGYEEY